MENSSAADESGGGVEPPSNQNDNVGNQEQIEDSFQKDMDFIKSFAVGADQDVLHSLIVSEKDNPDRVQFVLNEMLGLDIPLEVINNFKKSNYKVGDKRTLSDSLVNDPNDVKKSKPNVSASMIDTVNQNGSSSLSNGEPSHANEEISRVQQNIAQLSEMLVFNTREKSSTANKNNGLDMEEDAKIEFLNNIVCLFPDADMLFLIRETQNFKSGEDFSEFVKTVMLNNLYSKIGEVDVSCKRVPAGDPNSAGSSSSPDESDNNANGTTTVTMVNNANHNTVKPIKIKGLKSVPFVDLGDDQGEQDAVGGKINLDIETNKTDPLDLPAVSYEQLMAEPMDFSLLLNQPLTPPLIVPSNFNLENPVVQISTKNTDEEVEPVSSTSEDVDNATAGPSTEILRLAPRNFASGSWTRPDLAPKWTRPDLVQNWFQPTGLPEQTESTQQVETAETAGNLPLSSDEEIAAKTHKWVEDQTANLVRIFPYTDPTYLKAECAKMNCSDMILNEFVLAKLEQNDMPTRVEYEKRIEMQTLQNRYTKNFVIEDFLKAVPEPWTFFPDTRRDCSKYKEHSLSYLTSSFRRHHKKDIMDALSQNNNNLYLAYQHLAKNVTRRRTGKRTEFECTINRPTTVNIQFLQEVAFIENEEKIKNHLEAQRLEKEMKYEEARKNNNFFECQRCFDNEVLVEDIVYCPKDHNFCKNCVVRNVEVRLEDRRHEFICFLKECKTQFSLPSLQRVLTQDLFSKVLKVVQQQELESAGIEGLVYCPFCDTATILDPEEKVMACLNPECLKESCRTCKELSHIPLRCEEVRKTGDGDMRLYLENKISLAENGLVMELPPLQEGIHDVTAEFGAKIEEVMNNSVLNGGYGSISSVVGRARRRNAGNYQAVPPPPLNMGQGVVYGPAALNFVQGVNSVNYGPGTLNMNQGGTAVTYGLRPAPLSTVQAVNTGYGLNMNQGVNTGGYGLAVPAVLNTVQGVNGGGQGANAVGYGLGPATLNMGQGGNAGNYGLVPPPVNAGQGGNAGGRKAKGMFTVTNVKRIFYHDKFAIYKHHQLQIEKKKPPPLGFEIDSLADWMIPILNKNANEFFLFHGTQSEQVDTIAKSGFDDRLSKGGLYGRGTYFAENADKSDQYARSYLSSKKYMFLARVTLGTPYKATHTGQWIRPPEISKRDPTKGLYDSIIGISSRKNKGSTGQAIHQEFVLFDRYQCFPEFIIEYTVKY